ncbi:hypothetical protein HF850_09935 [Clostridium sp. SM-530-WT-3G]|nr:hypothetical protein [Clostridium sp. SM-530-WT-3G]
MDFLLVQFHFTTSLLLIIKKLCDFRKSSFQVSVTKEKLYREIIDKTSELSLYGMSYEEALERTKEVYRNKLDKE